VSEQTIGGRLGHRPALDGLRAFAIAAVVPYHWGAGGHFGLAGGFLGVNLFFVLSGFLITRLLLEEHIRTGAIGRAHFYRRRIARLFPGYLALVAGEIHAGGEIALPLLHDPHDARKVRAASDPEWAEAHGARPAATRFTPVERRGGFTLVEVEIATGVLHQIRAHLAFIGHPLAGDALYGGPQLPGLSRHFLHAARLAFAHPDGTRPRRRPLRPLRHAALLRRGAVPASHRNQPCGQRTAVHQWAAESEPLWPGCGHREQHPLCVE